VISKAKGVVAERDIFPAGVSHDSDYVKQKFFTGKNVELAPGYLVASEATYTGCDLETPDYHMSADKVEIWPGQKMIAHNAKFWIGNMVVYATPRYEQKLGEGEGAPIPSIGYNNDDGMYIRQSLQYPIADNLKAYANLAYYSKSGFKPNVGVKWDKSDYYFEITAGDFRDDDVWIEKKPEFKFGLPTRRIGSSPISYKFTAIYGKWTEDDRTSWHQEYDLYFSHDPIPLDKTKSLNLYLGTGVEHIRESYDDSAFTSWRFDSTLGKTWSPKLYTYVGYHYVEKPSSVFTYDEPDVATELVAGASYKLDKRHTVYYNHSYDLDIQKTYSQTYGWNQNFHCWALDAYHTTYTDGQDSKTSLKFKTYF
jgi:LPS-assembly protein